MKPDIRPIEILTRTILDTSPAWAIVYNKHAFVAPPDNIRGHTVCIDGVDCDMIAIECFGSEISVPFNASGCYPCKPYAPFEPIPWAVVEGEEIIEALYNVPANHTVYLPDNYDRYICKTPSRLALVSMPMRPGYHPSPRRFIDTDGSCVPVWVWEKNQ